MLEGRPQLLFWAALLLAPAACSLARPALRIPWQEALRTLFHLRKRSGIVVKLGGSAVTDKGTFETPNAARLRATAAALAARHAACGPLAVVHGAGSFGHFQARQFGVSKGSEHPSFTWNGFALTRQSVGKLNQLVTAALLEVGLPAVAVSPFPSWSKRAGRLATTGLSELRALRRCGLVPVLHGDAVVDTERGSAILSGDELLAALCKELRPSHCVFLTDVAGVFDKPPSEEGAALIELIRVDFSGDFSEDSRRAIAATTADHDVTGGMFAKLSAARTIASQGTPVCICEAGTVHAERALRGETPEIGTLVLRLDQQQW